MIALIVYLVLFLLVLAGIGYFLFRDIRAALDADHLRVFILDKYDQVTKSYVKRSSRGKSSFFNLNGNTYEIITEYVYKMGMFRVPTSFYESGVRHPKDLRHTTHEEKKYDGTDFETVQHHRFVEQLKAAWSKPFLSPEMTLMLIIGAVAAGSGGVWYLLSQELDAIKQILLSGAGGA